MTEQKTTFSSKKILLLSLLLITLGVFKYAFIMQPIHERVKATQKKILHLKEAAGYLDLALSYYHQALKEGLDEEQRASFIDLGMASQEQGLHLIASQKFLGHPSSFKINKDFSHKIEHMQQAFWTLSAGQDLPDFMRTQEKIELFRKELKEATHHMPSFQWGILREWLFGKIQGENHEED